MTAPPRDEVAPVWQRLLDLLEAGDLAALEAILQELHPSDVADFLETMEVEEDRLDLVRMLPPELASETLAEMEGDRRSQLLAALDPGKRAELLHELQDDDAADLIAELEPSEQAEILAALPVDEAGDLRGLLRYGEETAGGRMTTSLVIVEGRFSAGDAIQQVRIQGREVEDFYTVFVVDTDGRLLGTVPLDDLILANPDEPVASLVEPVVASVLPHVDQEEVGRLMGRYNMVSMPVVNEFDQLLGRITFDDVIDVMEAEQTEDILRLAGLSEEEELAGGWGEAVRARLPWLLVNLVTAAVAASVVFLFSEAIDTLWFLAAIMPVVAGMGGNAGTQALAVTVRRFAVASGPLERKFDVVGKEALVGLVNGIVLGVIVAGVAGLAVVVVDGLSPLLPIVVLLAMWGNIVVAGFAGAFVPTVLDRMDIDPAVASSVFVTTFTDLFGFFLLLGLATALLM